MEDELVEGELVGDRNVVQAHDSKEIVFRVNED